MRLLGNLGRPAGVRDWKAVGVVSALLLHPFLVVLQQMLLISMLIHMPVRPIT
jgi:hypothetical protein